MNTLFYISLFLLMMGVAGVYLYNLQKEKIEQSLISSRESVQNRVESQFQVIENNLRLLKRFMEILQPDPSPQKLQLYADLAAQAMSPHWIQYNGYFALEKKLAQKQFGKDGFILTSRRDFRTLGKAEYLEPRNFRTDIYTDPIYQISEKEIWYHIAKRSKEVEFTHIYFDETYAKKWFVTAALGIYTETGEFQGMVGIDMILDELSLMTEWTPIGKTGGALMVDTRTNQVMTKLADLPSEFIKIENRYEEPKMDFVRSQQWKQLLKAEKNISFFKGDNQKTYVVSVHRFTEIPWAILTFQEYTEAFGPLFRMLTLLTLIGLSGLILLLQFSQRFSISITRPLSRLMQSIETNITSVQKEETMKVNVHSTGYSEVQKLSQLVNRLVQVVNNRMHKHIKQIEAERAKSIHSARMASIGRLAGNIAHEINSPLTAISLYSEVLLKDLEKDPNSAKAVKHRIQSIQKLTDRIAKIVQGFLTLSREGKSDPLQKVSLSEIVNDTLNICKSQFRDFGAELIVDPIPPVDLQGRGVQLSQVLLNLLNNAFDAIEDLNEKWVHLEFEETEAMARILVSDSGHGISPDVVGKMMEPFFTTKDVHRGTGLGLSISKSIIEEHQGRLYYDPHSANTCFIVEVPKYKATSSDYLLPHQEPLKPPS